MYSLPYSQIMLFFHNSAQLREVDITHFVRIFALDCCTETRNRLWVWLGCEHMETRDTIHDFGNRSMRSSNLDNFVINDLTESFVSNTGANTEFWRQF